MTLWGGRFEGKLDPAAWALNASIGIDQRLASQDVRGSQAWAKALLAAGILTTQEALVIDQGLASIAEEFKNHLFAFTDSDEDIHTAIERRLGELIGSTAGKLHTGRSRNDQVATSFRLWLIENIPTLQAELGKLQKVLIQRAENDLGIIMPGYTHLQRAQPVLLSHWWLAHFWSLQRDWKRFESAAQQCACLPLGAGALAGAPFPVDRSMLAAELGFASVIPNSIDAVSDRDFAVEFLFCSALSGSHLSRLAEGIIIYTSAEFGFFELSDAFATGSSLMPQKKNPDVFELARAKSGVLLGDLVMLLSVLKGLPSAYDKDLQEDKAPVFHAYDTLQTLLPVLQGAISSLRVHPERIQRAIDANMLATELADTLVSKGIPFRQAHELVGKAIRLAGSQQKSLDQLDLPAYQSISPAFQADIYAALTVEKSLERRTVFGGTAPQAVKEQLALAKKLLEQSKLDVG